MDELKRNEVETKEKWRDWNHSIPWLNFKKEWDVRVIPPFGGAMARFQIKKGDKHVSVYLDCYDNLGFFGEPYWEIFPYQEDVYRCPMGDSENLMRVISEVLEKE